MPAMDPRETTTAIALKTGDIGAAFYFHPDTLPGRRTSASMASASTSSGVPACWATWSPPSCERSRLLQPGPLVERCGRRPRRSSSSRASAAREYLAAQPRLARQKLAGVAGLDAFCRRRRRRWWRRPTPAPSPPFAGVAPSRSPTTPRPGRTISPSSCASTGQRPPRRRAGGRPLDPASRTPSSGPPRWAPSAGR